MISSLVNIRDDKIDIAEEIIEHHAKFVEKFFDENERKSQSNVRRSVRRSIWWVQTGVKNQ